MERNPIERNPIATDEGLLWRMFPRCDPHAEPRQHDPVQWDDGTTHTTGDASVDAAFWFMIEKTYEKAQRRIDLQQRPGMELWKAVHNFNKVPLVVIINREAA